MMLKYNIVIQVKEKSLFDEMNATDPDPKVLLFAANTRWLEQFKRIPWIPYSCQASDLRAFN
jgi:hypothetical protein